MARGSIMSQNIVIPNKDNKVVLTFLGVDLTLSTDIKVNFGIENYTKVLNPTIVKVVSATELSLDLSLTNEVGKIFVTVTYFDAGSVNGTDITSRELNNLGQILVSIGTQLIIEDGSIVANANSYVTDNELKLFADLRGFTLPSTQPDREALLIKAMDYLFSFEDSFQGIRVKLDQELSFPRVDVWVRNQTIAFDVIPRELKNAQIEAAIAENSNSLLTNQTTSNVQSEKVDVLEVSYFNGGKITSSVLERVNSVLKPLLKNSGSGINAMVLRA